jgi:hypothetical protein
VELLERGQRVLARAARHLAHRAENHAFSALLTCPYPAPTLVSGEGDFARFETWNVIPSLSDPDTEELCNAAAPSLVVGHGTPREDWSPQGSSIGALRMRPVTAEWPCGVPTRTYTPRATRKLTPPERPGRSRSRIWVVTTCCIYLKRRQANGGGSQLPRLPATRLCAQQLHPLICFGLLET